MFSRSEYADFNTYGLRWRIETFFRASKESLGFEDCQSRDLEGRTFYILAGMISYPAIEETKFLKKKKSLEPILGILKAKKSHRLFD